MSLEDDLVRTAPAPRARRLKRWASAPTASASISPTRSRRFSREYGAKTAEELGRTSRKCRIAGRIQTIRRMGKAGFMHLLQSGERLQVYVRKDAVPERDYTLYEMLDLGDIVGVEGYLFRTRTGELSVHAEKLDVSFEDPALAARKMARPRRRRDPLPPALSGSDRESGIAEGFRDPRADHLVAAPATRSSAASSKWKRP